MEDFSDMLRKVLMQKMMSEAMGGTCACDSDSDEGGRRTVFKVQSIGSGDIDLERILKACARAGQESESSDDDGGRHGGFTGDLRPTFEYPCGTGGMIRLERFDVRPEVCVAVGGARHKDIVLAKHGQVATVIGVRGQPPQLFCHMEGNKGAGVFRKNEKLRVVSSLDVLPPGMPNKGRAPSEQHGWLEPTFRFMQGPRGMPHLELFDIRDDMCLKVGGFRHGQVVRGPGGDEHVTIGVRKDDSDDKVNLWFHTRGAQGAGIFPPDVQSKLRSVGMEFVREGGPEDDGSAEGSSHRSFRYPCGLVFSSMDSFDVRPEICQAVGGAKHGDIVLSEQGIVATVIGVKPEKGAPRLWCHAEHGQGAGVFDDGEELRVVGHVAVRQGGPPNGEAPSKGVQWLKPTFQYRVGLAGGAKYAKFDIRPDICVKVGGFKHGQVIRYKHGQKLLVIGVRQDPEDKRVQLWFRPEGSPGAGVMPNRKELKKFRVVGNEVVQEMRPKASPSSAPGGPLYFSFRYPCGTGGATEMEMFDTRPEVCVKFGGARHGDIVLDSEGVVATVIGVRHCMGKPRLFSHAESKGGAGVFLDEEVSVVARVPRVPEGGLEGGVSPCWGVEWLQETFRYAKGVRGPTEVVGFDVRDEVCLKVGGFRHGQVVVDDDGDEHVVIGVKRHNDGCHVALFLHMRGSPGAGVLDNALLRKARVAGIEFVHEAPGKAADRAREAAVEQLRLEPSFRYPCGPLAPTPELFDMRADVCAAFGDARSGDIVLDGIGQVATVVGVRAHEGRPRLWYHVEGFSGAGLVGLGERLRPIYRRAPLPEGGLDGGAAPSSGVQVLEPTFRHIMSVGGMVTDEKFDTRDAICHKLFGFKHGQVLRVKQLPLDDKHVVVGVAKRRNRINLYMRPGMSASCPAQKVGMDTLESFHAVGRVTMPEDGA